MQSDNKLIIGLLIIILILGIIMGLKVTGVIKPAEKNLNILETEASERYDSTSATTKLIGSIMRNIAIISVLIYIAMIIINIGIGKLYEKLSLPEWMCSFQKVYPVLVFIASLLFVKLQSIVMLLISILTLVIQSNYFKSLDMKGLWPISGIGAIIMMSIGTTLSLNSSLFEPSNSSSGGLWTILGLAMFVAYIGAYIVSNIRLAKRFDKGIGFTIGLAILPFVFQPILGFSREY